MKLRGLDLTLTCPEHGTLSLRCAHEELSEPVIGFALMLVGALLIVVALAELL